MKLIAWTFLIIISLAATAAASERPSFDCATAKSEREILTCGDARLAKADRTMASAYAAALSRLDEPTKAALRADQRAFLEALDRSFYLNFVSERGYVNSPPPKSWSIAGVLKHGRKGERQPLTSLDLTLADRIASLNALQPGLTNPAGLWINGDGTLELTPAEPGSFTGRLEYFVPLRHDYRCVLKGRFTIDGNRLTSTALTADQDEGEADGEFTDAEWSISGIVLTSKTAVGGGICGGEYFGGDVATTMLHLSGPVKPPALPDRR